ncbi:MAG TPA: zinc metalloprotease HtpX [Streptosporangiaceae bacterium]|nr:zinc metalloprotease HtpX [Streptosporangiaceae bacterium]
MARTRYASDPGLVARMGATMFLLGLVFVGFGVGLAFVILYFSSHRHGGGGSTVGPTALIVFAAIIGIGSALASYYWSDKIALRTSGARLVTPQDGPEAAKLHAVVDRLCAMADMPKPRVAIAPTQMPNAFATGRNSKTAVVCATEGILQRLDEPELEGVLAHEMSHVAHRDVAVMTIASFLGIVAALMVRFAFYSELFGGGGRSNNNNGNNALLIIPVMLLSIVVYVISFLLIRMLSRYRELSADRSGALLTGRPHDLANALVKVTGEMGRIPVRDLRQAEPLNTFFFAPALRPMKNGQKSLAEIFSTHPSLERRLKELDKISKQLGQG